MTDMAKDDPKPRPTAPSGPTADELLADTLAELGMSGLDFGTLDAEGSALDQQYEAWKNPLTFAAMSTTQQQSLLPKWARDLQILGKGKETAPPELFVFMRDEHVPGTPGSAHPDLLAGPEYHKSYRQGTPDRDVTKAQTVTRALNQPYLWEDDELQAAMERMRDAGLDVQNFEDANEVWQGLVERAAITYSASEGERKVTPWDVLDMVKRESGSEGGEGGEDGNFTVTSTNRSIQDIDEGEAWSVLQSNLSRMLGRDPREDEIKDFAFRMNQMAAKNPAISKTISRYKDGRLSSSNTTEVDSGFTGDDMLKAAYDSAQQDSEYAEYQSATTYMNAVMSAIGEIGG